jgi:hypothetical protein
MDQLKEFLRQCIKYRFWIAVGLAMLLPIIAYAAGSGKVKDEAAAKTSAIDGAKKKVQGYTQPTAPTAKYSEVLNDKTGELTKDVTESWKKLYARQEPLLAWPSRVHERFTKWGRKFPDPKDVDSSTVQFAIIDYVNLYPAYVTDVYKSFKPFDPETGEGVVSAPPEAALLRPAPFKEDSPPTLGKVWAAQERLWIQRTLLDVVAQVNKGAKTWDAATIRQVLVLDVGSQTAQDQRSIAKGEALVEADPLDDPSKPPVETASASSPEAAMMAANMAGMGGSGAGALGASESVFYITPKDDSAKNQFKIMPVQISVLIDQARIQDFLIALENSPMTIQVMDFELAKSDAPVVKPVQGAPTGMYGMMNSMNYQNMMMRSMGGMGGMYARQNLMMNESMMGMGMGYGGMGGGGTPKTGVNKRTENLAAEAKKRADAAKKAQGKSLFDPYYNIVKVTVYGQARFFNPPPVEAPAEPSQAEAAVDAEKKEETPKADDATKKEETPKADDATKKEETPKADDATKKEETPKAEDAEKKDASKKEETPKADDGEKKDADPKSSEDAAEKKTETPKAETPKAETPKADPAAPASK